MGISQKPIIAEVYAWVSGDTVAMLGSATDAGGDLAKENMIGPNEWAQTQRAAQTATSAVSGDGWRITLTAETSVSLVEFINIDDDPLPDGARFSVSGRNAAAAASLLVDAGSGHFVRPDDVWTAHASDASPIRPGMGNNPVRSLWIPGVDDLTTPAKPGTPVVTPWLCKDIDIIWKTSGTSYLEVAGVALGVNAYELNDVIWIRQIETKPVKPYKGYGHKWTVNWPRLDDEDATALEQLWEKSEAGQTPVFFCPGPGERAQADGTIAGGQNGPIMRGGLMRYLSFSRRPIGEQGASSFSSVSASFETWQEVPTGTV